MAKVDPISTVNSPALIPGTPAKPAEPKPEAPKPLDPIPAPAEKPKQP